MIHLLSIPQSIWRNTSQGVSSTLNAGRHACGYLHQKVIWVKDNYLTTQVVRTKSHNTIKAKILPLSNPPEWEDKMAKAQKKLERLQYLLVSKENELQHPNISHKCSCLPPHAKKTVLQEEMKVLEKQYEQIDYKIQSQKQVIDYFEKQRLSQVSSRFIGYVGMASNLAVPGSGIAVGVALTGVSIAVQEQLAHRLPDDSAIKAQELRSVRFGTFLTIGSSIVSNLASIYIFPGVKDMICKVW